MGVEDWLQRAEPGDRMVYGIQSEVSRPPAEEMKAAREAYDSGIVELFTSRLLDGRLALIAFRRREIRKIPPPPPPKPRRPPRPREPRAPLPRDLRPKCSVPDCETRLSLTNRSGVCRRHNHRQPHCRCQKCSG